MNRPIVEYMKSSKQLKGVPELDQIMNGIGMFINDMSRICKIVKIEERKNKKLLDQNHERIGKIISCHLVIEHFINRELEMLHNIDYNKRKESKLTFYNKMGLLPKKGKVYCQLIKGINELNRIRNNYAHNLSYEIKPEAIKEITTWVSKMPGDNNKKLNVTEMIEKFTQLCIFTFSMRSETAIEKFNALARKYPKMPIFELLVK